jgi:Cu(I)/Ag(I) efflux system membrane fusion protein
MKKTLFAAAVIAAFTFSSCSESNTENTASTTEHHEGMAHGDMNHGETTASVVVETPEFSSVAAPMKAQISELVGEYMKLKDALVASDTEAAKAAANEVLTVAKAMPVATLTTDEKAYAEEKRDQVVNSAAKIAGAANLDAQRENLEQLSEAVFSMAKAFDAGDETLYYQHCPMALNDQGAYWLSSNEDIRNPYFGDKMLKCGSNEEVYKN